MEVKKYPFENQRDILKNHVDLLPSAGNPDITSSGMFPITWNSAVMFGVFWTCPISGNTLITIASPNPFRTNPYGSRKWRWTAGIDADAVWIIHFISDVLGTGVAYHHNKQQQQRVVFHFHNQRF